MIDDITGAIVDCKKYKKRTQRYLIAVYHASDTCLLYQMYMDKLPVEIEAAIKGESSQRKKQSKFKKPTVDEIKEYVNAHSLNVDAEAFVDFYNSNGWKVGKNPMKDWKAACRNWSRRENVKPVKSGAISNRPTYDINKIAADARNNTEIKY